MNVLITNKRENELSKLNLEIIKTLRGEFSADEIISTFSNFYFNKMILDLTAIKNYSNISSIQKLSMGLDINKIIILIPNGSVESSPIYLSKLISMGLYNFTTKVEGIDYLYTHPNSYKDVAHLHNINGNIDNNHPVEFNIPSKDNNLVVDKKIIGFKNVTDGAGATSIVYMLKKELENFYNISVKAIELNKRDFIYIPDKTLVSSNSLTINKEIEDSSNYDIILIDLNDGSESVCDEVIYLIEASDMKMNKLKYKDSELLSKYEGKKILLTKCTLENSEIAAFEIENGIKILNAIRPFNDKQNKALFGGLLKRLGITK